MEALRNKEKKMATPSVWSLLLFFSSPHSSFYFNFVRFSYVFGNFNLPIKLPFFLIFLIIISLAIKWNYLDSSLHFILLKWKYNRNISTIIYMFHFPIILLFIFNTKKIYRYLLLIIISFLLSPHSLFLRLTFFHNKGANHHHNKEDNKRSGRREDKRSDRNDGKEGKSGDRRREEVWGKTGLFWQTNECPSLRLRGGSSRLWYLSLLFSLSLLFLPLLFTFPLFLYELLLIKTIAANTEKRQLGAIMIPFQHIISIHVNTNDSPLSLPPNPLSISPLSSPFPSNDNNNNTVTAT